MKDKIFSVVMPADIAHRARVVAAELETSRSALVCKLLTEFLANYKTPNKACSGFAAGRVKNKGSVKAANR